MLRNVAISSQYVSVYSCGLMGLGEYLAVSGTVQAGVVRLRSLVRLDHPLVVILRALFRKPFTRMSRKRDPVTSPGEGSGAGAGSPACLPPLCPMSEYHFAER